MQNEADAALLMLGRALAEAIETRDSIDPAIAPHVLERTAELCSHIIEKIAATPASTIEGLRVKGAAVQDAYKEKLQPFLDNLSNDAAGRAMASLIRDILEEKP